MDGLDPRFLFVGLLAGIALRLTQKRQPVQQVDKPGYKAPVGFALKPT